MRRFSIGRGDGNEIQIDHDSVSRRHAQLVERDDGQYQLLDVGSSNGTYYFAEGGWEETRGAMLSADDMVRIGEHSTSVAALLMEAGIQPGAPDKVEISTKVVRK